jgi:hypothetical protein
MNLCNLRFLGHVELVTKSVGPGPRIDAKLTGTFDE